MSGKSRILFLSLATLLLTVNLSVSSASAESVEEAKPVPVNLRGIWKVTKVLVNTAAERHFYVTYNDPDLMGDILLISPDSLMGTITDLHCCFDPTVTVKPTTGGSLIDGTAGRPLIPSRPATPEDYNLPFSSDDPVEPMWVNCKKGGFGGFDAIIGDFTWILILPSGQLAIRWLDSSILVLSRAPADTKPIASFDCKKAKTPVEKTICKSMELALFDRMVINSYKGSVDDMKHIARLNNDPRFLEPAKQLNRVYKKWLLKRNACGPDAACLKKSLEELNDIVDKTEIPSFDPPDTKQEK